MIRYDLRRAGRRGAALAVWSATSLAYGIGIAAGYRPTFATALHLPILVYGWAFITVAVVCATGVFQRSDRWHFAVAEFAAAGWGLLLCTHWTQPYGWASGLSWVAVSVFLLVASAWPEPARRGHHRPSAARATRRRAKAR